MNHEQLNGDPTLPVLYAPTMLWIVVVVPPIVMNSPMTAVKMWK
jgi:hypothetical protein